MENKASIDIGSNSCILLILDRENNVLVEESRITSLGKMLDKNKVFLEETMKETFDALKEYVAICDKHGIKSESVIMTGTEASRVAKNANEFYQKVHKELRLKIHLISGEKEAFYTALGISKMAILNFDEFVILDIGGASTELIKIKKEPFNILDSISLPVGSVRATDWLAQGIFNEKTQEFSGNTKFDSFAGLPLMCVAGTMTAISLMLAKKSEFDESTVNQSQYSTNEYLSCIEELLKKKEDYLDHSFPFLGKRLKSIKGGMTVSELFIQELTPEKICFSTYGLRYGTLLSGDFKERE